MFPVHRKCVGGHFSFLILKFIASQSLLPSPTFVIIVLEFRERMSIVLTVSSLENSKKYRSFHEKRNGFFDPGVYFSSRSPQFQTLG